MRLPSPFVHILLLRRLVSGLALLFPSVSLSLFIRLRLMFLALYQLAYQRACSPNIALRRAETTIERYRSIGLHIIYLRV